MSDKRIFRVTLKINGKDDYRTVVLASSKDEAILKAREEYAENHKKEVESAKAKKPKNKRK